MPSEKLLLLSVGGWDIFHAGIEWEVGADHSIWAFFHLALKPSASQTRLSSKVPVDSLSFLRFPFVPSSRRRGTDES